jgi:hypothetical protein
MVHFGAVRCTRVSGLFGCQRARKRFATGETNTLPIDTGRAAPRALRARNYFSENLIRRSESRKENLPRRRFRKFARCAPRHTNLRQIVPGMPGFVRLSEAEQLTRISMKTSNKKVYLVYVRGQTDGASYLLADCKRQEFMGIACIKGTYRSSKSAGHWMAGRVTYVPLESVVLVTEFDSFEAYHEMLRRHYEEKAK